MDKLTVEDLANKVEWEGGIIAVLEYGVNPNDLDPSVPDALREAFGELYRAWIDLGPLEREVEDILEDYR